MSSGSTLRLDRPKGVHNRHPSCSLLVAEGLEEFRVGVIQRENQIQRSLSGPLREKGPVCSETFIFLANER